MIRFAIKSFCRLLFVCLVLSNLSIGQSQSWIPDSEGLLQTFQLPYTNQAAPYAFNIKFKTNGPFGKDYIYGHWLDSDSLFRCVGTRVGGKWVSLPFHVNSSSWTGDIIQYGDTIYVGGYFDGVIRDKDSISIPSSCLLKVFGDSVWTSPDYFGFIFDFATDGDSLLVYTSGYLDSNFFTRSHVLKPGKSAIWQNPYTIPHPTDSTSYFGAQRRVEFWKGDIITINNISSGHFGGLARWDGQQWHGYGDGVRGGFSSTFDLAFYRDELYMSGSFTKAESPLNPGEFIARWDGAKWNEVGGGLQTGVRHLFVYDDLLYCHAVQSGYGDANIPYLAAWDGHQWCGTVMHNVGGDPPRSFGFVNDTLWVMFSYLITTINGDPVSYLNYFDGDYVNGPSAICSTLGLGEEENQLEGQRIAIYPNPSSGILNISLPEETNSTKVRLYSLSGQLVYEQQLSKPQTQVKLPQSLNGLYLLMVESVGQVLTEKVLVE